MAIDGTYNIEIDTPMGKQTATLTLRVDGDGLSGNIDNPLMGVQEFSKGIVDGDRVAWAMELNSPMGRMNLEYSGTVSGDAISGEVKAGSFGTVPFSGART